ncbi:hypothetical protein EDD22DRAFT_941011 [Suillus occidentalis]|nr:hypothetical protein EDD22DRAFT_941011 [Suillus occidentalis]
MSSAYDPSLTSIPTVRYLREKPKRLAVLSIIVHSSSLSVILISPTCITGLQTFGEISSPVTSLPLFAQTFSGGSHCSTREPFHVHFIHVLPPEIMISGWMLPQALASGSVGTTSGMPGLSKKAGVAIQDMTLDGWRLSLWNSPFSSHLLSVFLTPTFSSVVTTKESLEPFVKGALPTLLSTCASDVPKQFCEGRISLFPLYMSIPKTTRLIPSLETSFLHSTHTEHHRLSSNHVRALATNRPNERARVPRKPRPNAIITPSAYRPPVLASDRVLLWTTPHGIDFQHELESLLPESTILKMFFVALHSLDIDTRSNYGAGLLCFMQFCDCISIPEDKRMPASSDLLSAFVADASGTVSDSTVNNWLSGLHYWHIVNGADWHGSSSELLRHMRRGLSRLAPPSSKRARRPPVTLEALTQLRDGLDLSNSFDISVFAIACIAFWCCCRLGELVIPSTNMFNSVKHVSRSILPIAIIDSNDVRSSTFHIPWTKTTNTEGADISVTARLHPTCPLTALLLHLSASSTIPAHAPLFAFETSDTSWSPMTKPWFLKHCNNVWVTAGHPHMPGHAFRIGGATELLLEGVPPDIVAMQGRWKSRAFLDYWCKIESILPLFISTAITSPTALLHLQSVMKDFHHRHSVSSSTS